MDIDFTKGKWTNPISKEKVENIQKRAKFSLSSSDEIINNIIYDYDEFKLKLKDSGIGVLLK